MNASPPEQDRLRLGSVVFSGEGVAEMDQHKRVVFVPRDQVLGITLAYGSAAERPFLTLGIALVTLVISLYPVVYAINRYLTATVIQGEVLYLLAFLPLSAWLAWFAVKKRSILVVRTPRGSPKLMLGRVSGHAAIETFLSEAASRFGYHVAIDRQ